MDPGTAPTPRRRVRRGRAAALVLSVGLHAWTLAVLLAGPAGVTARPPTTVTHVDARLLPALGTLRPAPETTGVFLPEETATGPKPLPVGCDGETYTGIGVRVNRAGYILDLAFGGPADQAGLLAGDAILNIEALPVDVYPPGRRVDLRVLRDEHEVTIAVHIGRICNERAPPSA
jgi:hypothetical protein